MTKNKRITELEKEVQRLRDGCDVALKQDHETCEVCGGLFKREKMKEVEVGENEMRFGGFCFYCARPIYYCKHCIPKYDKIVNSKYYKTIKGDMIEVDKKGKLIKK